MSLPISKNDMKLANMQHALKQGKGLKLGIIKNLSGEHGKKNSAVEFHNFTKKILSRLNEAIGHKGEQFIEKLEPKEFTPQKVADRILGFVDNAVKLAQQNGGNHAALKKLEQTRKNIAKSFGEAKDMLEGLNVFSGKVADDANETWKLLQTGLDDIEARLKQTEELKTTPEVVSSTNVQIDFGEKETQRLDIKILAATTNDSNHQSSAIAYQTSSSTDRQNEHSVALLMDEANKLSNHFFNEDVQSALTTLSANKISLHDVVSIQVKHRGNNKHPAIKTYESVASVSDSPYAVSKLEHVIKPVKAFIDDFASSVKSLHTNSEISHPARALADVLVASSEIDERKKGLANALLHRSGHSMDAFARNLTDELEMQQDRFSAK